METLRELFDTFAPRGDRTAFIFRTGVRRYAYSYAWLADTASRVSSWLELQGVVPGDRVLLWGPNSPWWGAAFWGCVVRGAVVVPVDFMSGRDRAEAISRLTSARLVMQSRYKAERFPDDRASFFEDLGPILASIPPATVAHEPAPGDLAQLIYTSGTTGNPKGVMLTHTNLLANLSQVNSHIPVVRPEFTFLSLLPLSHMFEQMGGFFIPLLNGSSIVYLRTLKPTAIMEALAEEEVAVMIAVPRLLQMLRDAMEREFAAKGVDGLFRFLAGVAERLTPAGRKRLFFPVHRTFGRSFALFVSGGAPLSPDLFRFWQLLGFTLLEGYGLSECSPVLAANPVDRQLAGSVGIPLPGVELRLENGEIQARGKNIFPGYYDNDVATREAFTPDGWFRTGDLGEWSAEGYLCIKGRLKELIVTGAGINVYPDELETLLNRMPGVREGCVVGLDRGAGEEVHAVLILDGSGRTGEEILGAANGELDELHRITGFSLWPEAEFPKTTTLKIRKFQVKQRLLEGSAAGGGAESSDRLIALIGRVTGVPSSGIREESTLVADLGLTSIGRLELVTYLEQEFRLDLEEELIGPGTRVADLRRIMALREKSNKRERYRFWTNSAPVRWIRRLADICVNYPLFRTFVTLEVQGMEHLEKLEGPLFFIANHMSYLDQPAIMFALPAERRYRTATAAWAEFFFRNYHNLLQRLWKRFTFEYGSFALNLFPLPQEGGVRSALRFMGKLVDHDISILLFPEGERSWDGELLPFRPGLGIMARELTIPLVPVRIDGLTRVLPKGGGWPRRGKVTVTFGPSLTYGTESVVEFVARARLAVEALR